MIVTISVIVPVYNVEKYLAVCVKSILRQTFTDFELLLIDDGSTDKSGLLCDKIKKRDKRITVFHKTNGGLSDARNYGIERAKGEYITFVDSDDFVAPSYLKTLYELMEKYGACVSCVNYVMTSKRALYHIEEEIHEGEETGKQAIGDCLMRKRTFGVSACAKLFRRDLFDEIRFPVGYLYEDIFTTPYVFEKCRKVAYSTETLYYYYQRPGSITRSRITDKNLEYPGHARELLKYLDEHVPEVHEEAAARITITIVNQIIERMLYCPDYREKIYLMIDKSDVFWREAVFSRYVSGLTKFRIKVLKKSPMLYKTIFLPYSILKEFIKWRIAG